MILKIIRLPIKPALSKNNNNKLAFKKNNSNSKVNKSSISNNSIKYAKKSKKLSKSRKSKSEKTFKSQNLAKSRKKLLKNGNLSNFSIIKVGLRFLTFNAKITFNLLWLAFTKALIL